MASKIPQKEEKLGAEGSETPPDGPLLDLSDAAVKAFIRTAKRRGHVTHDQINALLASDEVNSEQIENILAMFSEIGINVIETNAAPREEEVAAHQESDEDEEDGTEGKNEVVEIEPRSVPAKSAVKERAERTDDLVRMYLGEMASVELLSREGEIAIAKRIEAGREAMIAGLCESPLTFQAIIIWRDELNDGKVLLRDIIDLDATYSGPDAKSLPALPISPDGQIMVPGQLPTPNTAPVAAPFRPGDKRTDSDETAVESAINESDLDEDEDKEN
jgi:RNA polymerase primary sigma factor